MKRNFNKFIRCMDASRIFFRFTITLIAFGIAGISSGQTQAPPPCTADISGAGNFSIGLQYSTPSNAGVAVYNTPVAGDIDNDGTVELVVMSSDNLINGTGRDTKNLRVFSGANGALEQTINTPYMGWSNASPLAFADVDGDGRGEIFIISSANTVNPVADRRYLFCYEDNGTLKWKSNLQVGYNDDYYGSSVNLADFNQDGIAEVYVYNQIFNAQTGVKLAEGGVLNNKGVGFFTTTGNTANSIAADILPLFPGLELVAGNQVYSVSISNTAGTAGNSMQVATSSHSQPIDAFTALADMDLDGDLDIVNAYIENGNDARLLIWDGQSGTLLANTFLVNGNSAQAIVGIPTIGDIDGDCAPEILIVTSLRLSAFELTAGSIVQKWNIATSDGSGATGQTLFDFNQDGQAEIVYRDQSNIRIINGSSGANLATFPCVSGTGWENPIVADVDSDGQAEIVVTCGINSFTSGDLRVYATAGDPWAPAREIWNQKSYNPVVINDDMSVPQGMQDHSITFTGTTCGCNGVNRPLNNWLVQATTVDSVGCPFTPTPDVTLSINSVDLTHCPDMIKVHMDVTNLGSEVFPFGSPVAFYDGDPTSSNAPLIGTFILTSAVDTGQTRTFIACLAVGTLASPFDLWAVVNDDGSLLTPYNLVSDFPVTGIAECDFMNNPDNVIVNCHCDSDSLHRTQTQGGWGTACNGNNPGCYRDANFASAFPNGVTVGCATGFTVTHTSSAQIEAFLSCGGQPNVLTANYVNPNCNGNSLLNVLVSQLTAITLSLGFDANDPNFGASSTYLGDMIVASGPFAGQTVTNVVAIANDVLGGCSNAYTASEMNNVITQLNQAFVDGTSSTGFLICSQIAVANVLPSVFGVDLGPNPSSGVFNIRISYPMHLDAVVGQVKVFDMMGRIVYASPVELSTELVELSLDMSHLANGRYLLQLVFEDQILTHKMLKY